MEQNELLRYTIRALDELGIPYLIGGSLASSAYGEPRLTNDIDLAAELSLQQVPGLVAHFPVDEFHLDGEAVKEAIRRKGQFNIIHPSSGYKVDVFVARQDAFSQSQFARRRALRLPDGKEALFASPEDVIINKLIYCRGSRRPLHRGNLVEPPPHARGARWVDSPGRRNLHQAGVEAVLCTMCIDQSATVLPVGIYWKMGQSERQMNDMLGMLRVQGDRLDRAYIQMWAGRLDLTDAWEAVLRNE